jgi:hypothetical protein
MSSIDLLVAGVAYTCVERRKGTWDRPTDRSERRNALVRLKFKFGFQIFVFPADILRCSYIAPLFIPAFYLATLYQFVKIRD